VGEENALTTLSSDVAFTFGSEESLVGEKEHQLIKIAIDDFCAAKTNEYAANARLAQVLKDNNLSTKEIFSSTVIPLIFSICLHLSLA
jgi:hypothetical protein